MHELKRRMLKLLEQEFIGWKYPRDWIVHGHSCYFFSPDIKSWTNSLAACGEIGGNLVEVNDVTENNFLLSKILPYNTEHWIGLTDKEGNDTYVWISSGQIPTFTFWVDHEPSHQWKMPENVFVENCVFYSNKDNDYMWNDYSCEAERHYICERTLTVDE
ncbi:CD209 antigen-like protein D [Mercenaria mercenaria]|uniref:CD209 antigen-like protein D n=1 Tax=Mercenaria mercenaria TaxID=6596 RepID=UPI00234EA796|nr:CD209 antigen-like protein D [Mercenaria mercenaria]